MERYRVSLQGAFPVELAAASGAEELGLLVALELLVLIETGLGVVGPLARAAPVQSRVANR